MGYRRPFHNFNRSEKSLYIVYQVQYKLLLNVLPAMLFVLPKRGLGANRVHNKFFPSNNHFEGQMMQLNTDFGVQSQPARVQHGVTEKKEISSKYGCRKREY